MATVPEKFKDRIYRTQCQHHIDAYDAGKNASGSAAISPESSARRSARPRCSSHCVAFPQLPPKDSRFYDPAADAALLGPYARISAPTLS